MITKNIVKLNFHVYFIQDHKRGNSWLLKMPGVSEVFPRDRYKQITKYLHYCDESVVPPRDDPEFDRLYKGAFVTNHLKRRFAEEFTPHQEVAVDECMIPFRGRLSFKQYHRDKPVMWDMKVWMLADSKTGYNYSFDMYVGRDDDLSDLQRIGKVSGIVLKLAKGLYGQGYHLYFDRFYTSPHLLHWLRLVDLSGCGTVMTNRTGFPKDLKVRGKGTQGESEWMQCANTGILATQWCDKKPIYFLSNIHVAERDGLAIRRHNKKGEAIMVNCTPTVHQYNPTVYTRHQRKPD